MRSFVRTAVVGLAGAIEGLIALAIGVVLLTLVAFGLTDIASGGDFSFTSLVPRAQAAASNADELVVEGSPEAQAAVRHAFSTLKYPIDTSGFKVVVTDPKNLAADTCGLYVGPQNIIYVSSDEVVSADGVALSHVLAHEIGHMIDATYFDETSRREFMRLRGFAAGTSWADPTADWNMRPSEDFAEVYAALDTPNSPFPIATYAGPLTNAASLQALIESRRPDPYTKTMPLKLATQLNIAWNGQDSVRTNPILVVLACVILFLATGTGAANSVSCAEEKIRPRQTWSA